MRSEWVKIAVGLLALLPGALALALLDSAAFATPGAVLNAAGRIAGIVGFAMLLLAAAFSCRVPGFDRPFGGLTKLWQLHHRLGGIAFILLLAHPLLLTLGAAEVSLDAAVATLLGQTPALWLGWGALLLMMVFLAPSFAFFGTPDYQRWKWLHRLSGVAVALALLHTFGLARALSGGWAAAVWGAFALAALAALGYRWWFARFWGRRRYRVQAVAAQANNVVELTLEPEEGERLRYVAGQFVYLTPYDKSLTAGCGEEHPYTLSSAPDEPALRVAIKDLGDASRALQSVTPGSSVGIEGPYGDFFPREESGAAELWIAGGIGITPFLGRLRHLARHDHPANVHLVFCVQDEARALFLDELQALSEALDGVRLTLHYFYREGPLSGEFLRMHCPDIAEREAYICGPEPLIELARKLLAANGVSQRRITTEEFVLL